MSRLEQPEPSDRPIGNWSDENEQPPYRHDTDGPSEPAIEATTSDDHRASFSIRPDGSSDSPPVPDIDHEPAEPPRRSEQVRAADGNGSGAAAAPAEPEPEPAEQAPVGPPKRGWWKRLIE